MGEWHTDVPITHGGISRECPGCGNRSIMSEKEAERSFGTARKVKLRYEQKPCERPQYIPDDKLTNLQENGDATHACNSCGMWWSYDG